MHGLVRWARRWLEFPRALWLGLGAALLVSLPFLGLGFVADDFTHLAVLKGEPTGATPFNLYQFISGDPEKLRSMMERGFHPWWTLPTLKLSLWRPLSSATQVLDFSLFGTWAPGYHLHATLWYLALVATASVLLRRALPGPVGGLALLLFALDVSHALPAGWIANRNAVVAVTPALLGLVAHQRWREEGWRPGRWLCLVGMVVGLLGGEAAVGVFALLGAYELWGREEPLAARVRALVPAGLVGVAYVALYKARGYGSFGSGAYTDALAEPLGFLREAPGRLLGLLGGELSGLFAAELSLFGREVMLAQRALGAGVALAFGWLLWRAWPGLSAGEKRGARWLLAGSLLALLPVLSALAHDRLLLVASLGASVLLALVLREAWRSRDRHRLRAWAVAGLVAVPHLVLAPPLWLLGMQTLQRVNQSFLANIERLGAMGDLASRDVVVLVDPEPLSSLYTLVGLRALDHALPRTWRVLSMAPCHHRVERTGPDALEVRCLDGQMQQEDMETLFRATGHGLRTGDRVALRGFTATVLETAPGGGPTRVEFRFGRPLEDGSLLFLLWRGKRFEQVAPPPLGGVLDVPFENPLAP